MEAGTDVFVGGLGMGVGMGARVRVWVWVWVGVGATVRVRMWGDLMNCRDAHCKFCRVAFALVYAFVFGQSEWKRVVIKAARRESLYERSDDR